MSTFKNKMFGNRTVGFYVGVASAVLALCAAVIYYVYSNGNNSFVMSVSVLLVIGVVCEITVILSDFPLLPALPAVCYGAAFAILMSDRFTMFSDYINGVVGLSSQGDILELIIAILVLIFLGVVGGCVSSFSSQRKA